MGTPNATRKAREAAKAKIKADALYASEKAKRSYGTPLTDYEIKKKKLSQDLQKTTRTQGKRTFAETDKIVAQQVFAPTLLADEQAIARGKKKKITSDRLRSGRLSTILGETLG